ncbi:ribonuclease H-like domain-containing protein [Tanacetum coccineum]
MVNKVHIVIIATLLCLGEDVNTLDFPSGNIRNDAQSSDGIHAAQNEHVTTLEENIFSEGNLDQNLNLSSQGTQTLRRSSRQTVFLKNYNDFVVDFKVKYGLEKFTDVMNSEIDALLRNDTWEITELPIDRKAIEGIDYEETFSPMVKMVSVRCLLNLVVLNCWHVFQLDVNNAFLYGDLVETVYMKPPEDFSLYTKSDKGVFVALLVYVDDIIITGNSMHEIEKFKTFLKSKFMIKDLGKLKYFLGIEDIDNDKGMCLYQRNYVLDLLSEYGTLACKPGKTPLQSKLIISNEATIDDPLLNNIIDYQN